MKEVIFETCGMPHEVLKIVESEAPEPKAHEVQIKVVARNINPSDIMFIRGMYGITPKLPSSAGFEASGVVSKSDEAGKIPAGTRVMFTAIGTWREYLCIPASLVIPIPEGMSDEIACQAFVNPMTAYGMIEKSGLKSGEWLLITAGASAFGKFAIQMAKAKGIKVACTVRQDSQKEYLKELGADLVINTETEKLQKVIASECGEGVSIVFDAVGGVLGGKALASLKAGGKMMVFGLLSLENIPLNSGLLIFKNISVEGFWLTTWMESMDDTQRKSAFKSVFGFLMNADSKVDVGETFPLEKFAEAITAYETQGRNGKILLMS
jgi:NADPH:quinone reductase-like Zn-dependent oxidoreductase